MSDLPSEVRSEVRRELFVGGQWKPARSGQTFDTIDPSTEEVIASVARGGPEDVDDAVGAARDAFKGQWRRVTPEERARLLSRVARELEGRLEEFARLETLDTGKPLAVARDEIRGCVKYFDYYAGAADKIHGETIPLGPDYLNYTVREPMGVTAHIVPWNAPLSMVCCSLAPALAAGNTAVIKPAEQTPLTALKFAEVLRSARFLHRLGGDGKGRPAGGGGSRQAGRGGARREVAPDRLRTRTSISSRAR